MGLWLSWRLGLGRPLGNSGVAELRRMRVDSRVESQIKKMRALNSRGILDCASMTRTPLTRRGFESKIKLWTTLYGRMVKRAVFFAAGKVEIRAVRLKIVIPPPWRTPHQRPGCEGRER